MIQYKLFSIVVVILVTIFSGTKSNDAPRVIIIGAGAAGIAAASKLLENNITDIVVLEAEGRIGGRIHTVKFGERAVELGAQFCVGSEKALVYNAVKDYDLLGPVDTTTRIYHLPGGKRVHQNFTSELEGIIGTIYSISPDAISDNADLGQFMFTEYNKIVSNRYKFEPQKLKLALEFLNAIQKEILIYGGGFSWFDRSAKAEIEKMHINALFDWKGQGYKTFLDFLLKRQPSIEHKIMLNKHVDKIYWKDNISVECSDGAVYKADHVISTVSLGVLKNETSDLFSPNLPKEKNDAIKNIGIVACAKVILRFPIIQWPNAYSISFMWPSADIEKVFVNIPDYPWVLDSYGFYMTKEYPHELEFWFAGADAPKIELLPDDELLNGIMLSLNTFLGENVTKPDAMLRSKWYSHPNFLGTNSYDTVESYKSSSREVLSQPLLGYNGKLSLLFSGEATSFTRYGTVDGAVESGFREAENIINLYK